MKYGRRQLEDGGRQSPVNPYERYNEYSKEYSLLGIGQKSATLNESDQRKPMATIDTYAYAVQQN